MSDKALGGVSKVPRGSLPNTHHAPEERYYRRFESSPVPTSVVSTASRTGAVTALRSAAALNDPEHIANISHLGIEYVRTWLLSMADALESKEFEKNKDGIFDYGDEE